MSSAALLLVIAICNDAEGPERICSYMDVTQRLEVANDRQCFELAAMRNAQLAQEPGTPRYACITRSQFLALLKESAMQPGKTL